MTPRMQGCSGVAKMVEIKDSRGGEFHWQRQRIVALVFAAVASPIFFTLANFGHETLGAVLWFAVCIGLTIAYVLPTPLRKWMQRLIPTSVERAERSGADLD